MKRLLFIVMMVSITLPVLAVEANIVCSKAQNIRDQWGGILPTRSPIIPSCRQVLKDEPFTVNVFFMNPAVQDEKVKVSGKLTIYDPDGNIKYSTSLKTQDFNCSNPSQVFLFPDFLTVSFDPPDSFGSYLFKAVIKDELADTEKTVETSVELLEKYNLPISAKPLEAMTNFYLEPGAQNIIPAFKEYSVQLPQIKQAQGKNFNPASILALFHYSLAVNPQLWPEFIDYMKTLEGENLHMAIWAASCLGPEFNKLLPDNLKEHLVKFSFDVETPNFWQLDILWSEFMITGRKAPVMKIANAVNKLNTGISIEEFKKIPNPTEEDRQALTTQLTGRAALWSLSSNAKQHELVVNYLECALYRKEFKEAFVVMALGKMLSEVTPAVKMKTSK